MKRVNSRRGSAAALTLLLGACSLAPPLKTPVVPSGDAYKELGPWTPAQPADRLPRDSWWRLYDSAELDDFEKKLIAGDTLFAGSIGRTDLPGGSFEKIIHSLREKVLALPDETVVVPGHGSLTTIGEERESNPFLGKQ